MCAKKITTVRRHYINIAFLSGRIMWGFDFSFDSSVVNIFYFAIRRKVRVLQPKQLSVCLWNSDLGFPFSHLLPNPHSPSPSTPNPRRPPPIPKQETSPPLPQLGIFMETSGDPAHLAQFMFWWKLLMFPLSALRVLKLFILIKCCLGVILTDSHPLNFLYLFFVLEAKKENALVGG